MNNRAQQFYKINSGVKKSYHQLVREGKDTPEKVDVFKEINANIVTYFAHNGMISHEWAEALGHHH